jgi:tryptophan synthase beta subunit
VRERVLAQIMKALGEAVQPALRSWSTTARLAFLMISAAIAAAIYARFK